MPWTTPTLKEVRTFTRDNVLAALGARALIPNSVLRIMSDTKAALTHLTLLYLDWIANQLLPDTAETEFLDRHGVIWLSNADGSKGRKSATFATGRVDVVGDAGEIIPAGSVLTSGVGIQYEVVDEVELGSTDTEVIIRSLTEGAVGNLDEGTTLTFADSFDVTSVTAVSVTGGADEETDDELRERILQRIQNPPMGGDKDDYTTWALRVPGVTRAWAASEMGIGTITIRFLMDDLRSDNNGLPEAGDIQAVMDYIDLVRPVTVKDCFVYAPIPYFYDMTISALATNNAETRARIETSIKAMERRLSKPGQTMYRSWVSEAISQAIGESHHELDFDTTTMPSAGYMPILGTITYAS